MPLTYRQTLIGTREYRAAEATTARAHFAEILDTVEADGQPVVIICNGKRVAAIVPISMLRSVQ